MNATCRSALAWLAASLSVGPALTAQRAPSAAAHTTRAAEAAAAAAAAHAPARGDRGRTITRDSVLSFVVDRAGGRVIVLDLLNGDTAARTAVCHAPGRGALTDDDVAFVVTCGDGARWVNTASYEVVPAVRPRAAPVHPRGGARKNEVVVIGTIHDGHRTSTRYSTTVLRDLLRAMRPAYVLTEIAPNRLAAAMEEFQRTGAITEPRVVRFPEYVDVLFPLTREMKFTIVPTAGWTRPMDRFRSAALKRIEADPARRADWEAYTRANALADSIDRSQGADDPYWINSEAYDRVQTAAHEPYNRLFNRELGPGGWDHINTTHFGLIARALDAHRGEGVRFVITYGAGHKEWFLRALKKRRDIVILDVAPFLERIGIPRAP